MFPFQKGPLPPVPGAWDWEKFRKDAHATVDFIVDYQKSLEERRIPVQPSVKPNFLQAALQAPSVPPAQGKQWSETLADVQSAVVPGMLHWQHPDFFGYFPAMASPPALLGDLMASAMNQPGFSWVSSPAASELEVLVMNWMAAALGLPPAMTFAGTGGGVLQPSATEAAIVAILAAKSKYARTRRTDPNAAPPSDDTLVAYVSDQSHFCVEKAAKVLGIRHFRVIPSRPNDSYFAGNRPVDVTLLRAAIEADLAQGLAPFFLSGNFGATGICAIDDLSELAAIATEYNLFFNIDAAYAGVVALVPAMRALTESFALADAIFINASKWMSTLFNASMFFFKERADVVPSLNASGVYLDNQFTDAGSVVDFKDYQLGLGRPFRSLKMYTVLTTLGIDGIAASIQRHVILARYLFDTLQARSAADARDPLVFPVAPIFGLVCFALRPSASEEQAAANERTLALLKALNESNQLFAVHTLVGGIAVIRIALAHPKLAEADMDRLADNIFAAIPH